MNSSYFNIRGDFTVDWDDHSDNIFITRPYARNTEETITFEHKDESFTMCHKVITNNVDNGGFIHTFNNLVVKECALIVKDESFKDFVASIHLCLTDSNTNLIIINLLYDDIDRADYHYNILLLDRAFSSVAGVESNLQTMKQIKDLRKMI